MTERLKKTPDGAVTLTKALTTHELWAVEEPYCRRAAWVFLLMMANDRDRTWVKTAGDVVDLKRGQMAWSVQRLAQEWRWGREKVSGFLKYLQRVGCVRWECNTRGSVITIINYDTYNPPTDSSPDAEYAGEPATDRHLTGSSPTADPTTDRQLTDSRPDTEVGRRSKEVGKGNTHSARGSGFADPDGTWQPTLEEFVAWGRAWPGHMAAGAPADIPLAWLEGWFAHELSKASGGFMNWKKRAAINFVTDWRAGRPKARGLEEAGSAEISKNERGWSGADV